MLRTRRATASLIRALIVGTALPIMAMSSVTLVACQDESQPEYWVEKLDDNAWRARAIKQLDQFYEDSVTRSNQAGDAPEQKQLVDKIVAPLTNTYVTQYDNLDDKSRHRLIKLLATMRDPRTEPALTKAIGEFAEKGRGGEDLKWAARAAADMKLASTADEMIGAYSKLRADSEEGGPVWRDMIQSMNDMADKSWTPKLVAALEPDMDLPQPGEQNKEKVSAFRNQQFWQTAAVQLLGNIGDPAGVDPLLKVMLDPTKGGLQSDAAISLVKLGKPAVTRAIAVLQGEDKSLVDWASQRARKAANMPAPPSDSPHVRAAAIVLGTIGHSSAAPALIAAIEKERNETNQAVLLREITKLPASPATEQAFKSGFQRLEPDAVIPPGQPALQVLAESATSFFDPELVPWLISETAKIKDDEETRSALLVAAIKLMVPEQVASVGAAVDKYGSELEKSVFNEAAGVVKQCGKEASCYLDAATKAAKQGDKAQFVGIKATYMVGIFGNEKVRDQLVSGVDPISNAAVRFTAAKVIDFLSPAGSTSAADELQKVVDGNTKRGDREKMAGDAPIKQVIYRLRSRAQS
jgi:PBS lyase HEAT-like repeat-containing protein